MRHGLYQKFYSPIDILVMTSLLRLNLEDLLQSRILTGWLVWSLSCRAVALVRLEAGGGCSGDCEWGQCCSNLHSRHCQELWLSHTEYSSCQWACQGAWSSRHFLAFHFKVIIQTNKIKLISRNVEYFPSRFMADVISTGPKLLSLGFKIRHSWLARIYKSCLEIFVCYWKNYLLFQGASGLPGIFCTVVQCQLRRSSWLKRDLKELLRVRILISSWMVRDVHSLYLVYGVTKVKPVFIFHCNCLRYSGFQCDNHLIQR